jgi:thiol-disulfide isomerase/thioredoxin
MKIRQSLSVLCVAASSMFACAGFASSVNAQEAASQQAAATMLSIGDKAPAISVEGFVKGSPVDAFQPGHIYVMEFWATWCGPCIRGMPHLSEVQKKFDGKATIIGVNVWEEREYKPETLQKVKDFVAKKDADMGYTVAYDGAAKAMDTAYMKAAGKNGIPCAFVISGDGRVAYIGHPMDDRFEGTIQELVDGKFDFDAAKKSYEESAKQERIERERSMKMNGLLKEAATLFNDNKVDEGVSKMDEAAQLMPEAAGQIEMRKAKMLLDAGQIERANAISGKLVDGLAKDDWQMLTNIARNLASGKDGKRGDLDIALNAANRAVELSKSAQAQPLAALAYCQWAKGDKAAAIGNQTKAVELSKGPMKDAMQKQLDAWNAEPK